MPEKTIGRTSKLRDLVDPDDPQIRSKLIARCLDDNDELVIEAVSDAADYLGAGLGSLVTFYNPQRIVLGGGLIEATTLLFERASLRTREVALPGPGRHVEIVRTALVDNSGIIGAARMGALAQVPQVPE